MKSKYSKVASLPPKTGTDKFCRGGLHCDDVGKLASLMNTLCLKKLRYWSPKVRSSKLILSKAVLSMKTLLPKAVNYPKGAGALCLGTYERLNPEVRPSMRVQPGAKQIKTRFPKAAPNSKRMSALSFNKV